MPRNFTLALLTSIVLPLTAAAAPAPIAAPIDPRTHGAKADGKTLDTAALQAALDACASAGGGTVRLERGTFLSGTIDLRDGVSLEIAQDATLLGSPDPDHYPDRAALLAGHPGTKQKVAWGLVVGANIRRAAIRGHGTIDGNGAAFRDRKGKRPKAISMVGCSDIVIESVTLRNSGSWMQHYRDCDGLVIRGIAVHNHVNYNNDGLDIDSCRDVTITGCTIDSDDDGLVLKSLSTRPCENIAISHCDIRSHCNALKMGTESGGGFRNVTIAHCQVRSPHGSQAINGRQRGLAGVALEIVDGGAMEQIEIRDIQIDGVTAALFIRLGDRGRVFTPDAPRPRVGTLRGVTIRDVTAVRCSPLGSSITGLPGHPVEDIELRDVRISVEGGVDPMPAPGAVRERPERYPESTMFGNVPAFGLYCRHARNLRLHNVSLESANPDARPALLLDDVHGASLDAIRTRAHDAAPCLAWVRHSRDIRLANWTADRLHRLLVRVEGAGSNGIDVSGIDPGRFLKVVALADDAPKDAVRVVERSRMIEPRR